MVLTAALLLFFGILFFLLTQERKTIAGKKINLFRALLPSWRFFEDLGPTPELWVKTFSKEGESEWKLLSLKTKRNPIHLFYNPRGNHLLAVQSLLQIFMMEVEALPEASASPLQKTSSYLLIENLVKTTLKEEKTFFEQFQFKITLSTLFPTPKREDSLISALHGAKE